MCSGGTSNTLPGTHNRQGAYLPHGFTMRPGLGLMRRSLRDDSHLHGNFLCFLRSGNQQQQQQQQQQQAMPPGMCEKRA